MEALENNEFPISVAYKKRSKAIRLERTKGGEFKAYNKNILYPMHPFRAIICGKSNTGKSQILNTMLTNPSINQFDYVIMLYSVMQPKYTMLQKSLKEQQISFVTIDHFPTEEEIRMIEGQLKSNYVNGLQTLVVCDDLMDKSSKSNFINEIFTKFSHHLNCSVFVIAQSFTQAASRTQRLNLDYIFFKDMAQKDAFRDFIYSIETDKKDARNVIDIYNRVLTHDGYAFILVDLKCTQLGRPELKYRLMEKDTNYAFNECIDPKDGSLFSV